MKDRPQPFLVIAYVGSSGAVERLITPNTAAKRYPKLFKALLEQMRKQDNKQLSLWGEK